MAACHWADPSHWIGAADVARVGLGLARALGSTKAMGHAEAEGPPGAIGCAQAMEEVLPREPWDRYQAPAQATGVAQSMSAQAGGAAPAMRLLQTMGLVQAMAWAQALASVRTPWLRSLVTVAVDDISAGHCIGVGGPA